MSDTSDRNFVLIMFLVVYAYLLNIQTRISLKNDWDNTTCSPLNLFTSSFYQSDQESNNQFGNCVKQFSKGIASGELTNMVNTQNTEFEKVTSLATNNMNDINKNITEKSNDIVKRYNKTNEKIDSTDNSIKAIKDYSPGISKKIDDFKEEIKSLFSNISSYVNKS
jgi:gas vesicle protein